MSLDFSKEANIATIVGSIIAGLSLIAIFFKLHFQELSKRKEKTLQYVSKFEDSDFYTKYTKALTFVYHKHQSIKQNEVYSYFLISAAKKELENPINLNSTINILLIVTYFNNLGSLYFHNLIDRKLLTEIFGAPIVYNHTIFKWLFRYSNRLEITKGVYGNIKGIRSLYQASYWDSMAEDIKSRLEIMNRIKLIHYHIQNV